jgi:urea transport system permease protein
MQNAGMAQTLGVRRNPIYALTFGVGAALAEVGGALYAPTMTLIPTMGAIFIVESFVTVVVGGASVLLGTAGTPKVAVIPHVVRRPTVTQLVTEIAANIRSVEAGGRLLREVDITTGY